jgi:predicted DNA-binding transcriptional regulator YafY
VGLTKKKDENMSNNVNILRMLRILERDSDENNILTAPQIVTKLRASGASPSFDRRAVYSLIDTLIAFGYDISTYAENKKGYFLRTRTFENSEIRFLIDSVATSKSIPNRQRGELIAKLAELGGKSFKCAFANMQFLSGNFAQNPELFLNIELVDEAISTRSRIRFSSCNYGVDKKLHPLSEGKLYVVSPYKMVVQNQKYYLICNYDGREGLSHIRLDRMTDVSIVPDGAAKPLRRNWDDYISEHPYMYAGESVRATLRVNKAIIGDILDTFGANVSFFGEKGETAETVLKANRQALCYWAVQYGTECEVLSPGDLRADVARMVKTIADKY